jgi:sugar phosphate permease
MEIAVTRRYRWVILAVGVTGQAAFSALLLGISAIAPEIQRSYGLSLAEIGVVLAATSLGSAFTLLPWGLLADRFGERAVLALGLTGSAGALVGVAYADSFAALVALLALAGALGASVNSASGRAVMGWFDASQRGLALGIRQTAVPMGGAVAAIGLPALSLRSAFLALAVAALAAALLGAALIRDVPAARLDGPIAQPLRDGGLWRLCGAGALYLGAQIGIAGFVVLFLHAERGYSNRAAAGVLALIQVLGGVARIAAGRWSDRLGARVLPLRLVGLALTAATGAVAALVDAPEAVLVGVLVVAGTLGLSWNGLSFTAAAERAGRARSGAAIGFQQTLLAVAGIAMPIGFASVVDATSWRVGFALAALCPLAGWALLGPLQEARASRSSG